MAAGIQVMQKSYFCFFENFIKEHLDMLHQSRVFIFGAGIRGCNLLWILKAYNFSDVYFVDNNAHKQGTALEECPVLSFEEASRCTKKHVFLCPVENGNSILEQLSGSGRKENEDYFDLDFSFTDYWEVISELKKQASDYTLLFGCCVLSSYILQNSRASSLGEILKTRLFSGPCKLCTLPGFYPAIYYYAIKTCMRIQNSSPQLILMLMEVSSLSPYAPMMMGTQNYQQHRCFIEQLAMMVPEDQEMQEYLQKVNERLERSKRGNSPTKAENTLEATRKIYKLKYMYQLREDDEAVIYTKKILAKMEESHVPVVLLFPPVDYQRGEQIWGECFMDKFSTVVKRMQSFLGRFSCGIIDASFIAESDMFVPPPARRISILF